MHWENLKITCYSFVAFLPTRRTNHKPNEPQRGFEYFNGFPGYSKFNGDSVLKDVKKKRNGKHLIRIYGLGSLTSRKETQFFWAVARPRSNKTGWRAQSRWKVGRLNLSSLPTAHIKLAGRSVGTTWSSASAVETNSLSTFLSYLLDLILIKFSYKEWAIVGKLWRWVRQRAIPDRTGYYRYRPADRLDRLRD